MLGITIFWHILLWQGGLTMCTAISFSAKHHYFGRNLDLEYCLREAVTITPRNYEFYFRKTDPIPHHYAMIGTATISQNYPLYYEATNEMGLSMAGLNFPDNAFYNDSFSDAVNISPFELIPWVLCRCSSVKEAGALLRKTNIAAIPFSEEFPLSPLHWIINDAQESVTVECVKSGLMITENPVGVLTNNPPFDYHLHNLAHYLAITPTDPKNNLIPHLDIKPYSRGMGAIGLPGDLSSASRFIRAVFTKSHSIQPNEELAAINQFFHILSSVAMTEGSVEVGQHLEKTVYTCCCDTDTGVYYYTTYENSQISAVHMHHEDLDSDRLVSYPLLRAPQIRMEN